MDLEELGDRVQRIWIKGQDNILGDAPSRNPEDRDACRNLPVPSGPVKRIIRQMFEVPIDDDEEAARMYAYLDGLDGTESQPRRRYRHQRPRARRTRRPPAHQQERRRTRRQQSPPPWAKCPALLARPRLRRRVGRIPHQSRRLRLQHQRSSELRRARHPAWSCQHPGRLLWRERASRTSSRNPRTG